MRKHAVLLIAFVVAGTGVLMAQFWENRGFAEWNDNQVQRILEDSPWAQSTPVTLRGNARSGVGGTGRGMAIVSFGFQRGGGLSIPQAPRPTMVVVRWESALPVRQALAVEQFGDEVETSEDAIEYLGRTPTSYVVRVIGIQASADVLGSPESLAAGARLIPREGDPVRAIQAQLERAGRGVDLYLAFPKEPPAGRTFTVDDRNVQVELDADTIELRRRFNLNDMVYQGNLEM